MEKNENIKSVTFVLSGSLLQMFNGIGGGFWSTMTAILGIVLFFIGLSRLKGGLDEAGKGAVKLLIIAAILSGVGFILKLIPVIGGVIASVFVLAAFVIQLIGYIKFKSSDSIGEIGKSGVTLLLVAMILAAFGALLGIVPFLGGVVVSIVSFIGLILLFLGWLRIQEGLME